jgi:hypothetical protein
MLATLYSSISTNNVPPGGQLVNYRGGSFSSLRATGQQKKNDLHACAIYGHTVKAITHASVAIRTKKKLQLLGVSQ